MTPDRHLGSAWIDKCRPDLLITESTYATTIRDSKRCRERDFLKKVHTCVENGGKVSGVENKEHTKGANNHSPTRQIQVEFRLGV
jgi:hypothetical protein